MYKGTLPFRHRGTCRFGRVVALPPAQPSVAAMPGVSTVRVLRIHIYLVVAAQPHEENNRLDVVEAVHPFSPLAPLSPDVYQGIPIYSGKRRQSRTRWREVRLAVQASTAHSFNVDTYVRTAIQARDGPM